MEEPQTILLDTGDQQIELVVDPDSRPLSLAREFCFRHHLDLQLIPLLERQIEDFLSQQAPDSPRLHTPSGDDSLFVPSICKRSEAIVR
jgi:hypothetical protein